MKTNDNYFIKRVGNVIELNGISFVEITEKMVSDIRPGQYVNYLGEVFDSFTNVIRHPCMDRYLMVYLYKSDGSRYHINAHRLIMLAFQYREDHENLVINHIDGIKSNNNFSNLEWCTIAENNQHAFRTGLNKNTCENHIMAKLTNDQVREICKELEKPRTYGQLSEIARKYGVKEIEIAKIANGTLWTEISKDFNIDFSQQGVESILTKEQVIEICEELSKGRYHGQAVELGKKFGVSSSTIKEIIQRRSWTEISKNYDFPSSINTKLTENQIHKICQIIQNFGYFDNDVYMVICEQVGLEPSDKLMHNIRRLCRKDPNCYHNITSQYHWNY